jgi:hypothetical protein
VVTLVAGGTEKHGGQNGYTLGGVALAGSVRAACADRAVAMVAMVTQDVNHGNLVMLRDAGWELRTVAR